MSVIACITVHECDGCKRIASLKTGAQYTTFEQTWYEGLSVDFCPRCWADPKNEPAIMADRAKQAIVANTIRRLDTVHCSLITDHSPEVAHAH